MTETKTLEQEADQKEQVEKVSKKEPEAQVSTGKKTVSEEKTPEDIAAEVKVAAETKAATDAVEAWQKTSD